MKLLFLFIASLSLLIGCRNESGQNQSIDGEWTALFNGSDLSGWSVKSIPADQSKEYWHVRDGYIEGNSMGDPDHNYVWLATENEYGDFHLKLKFQVFKASAGNSGVQFRSHYDDSDTARYGGWLNGPQVDIHGPTPMRTGLIYDETDHVRRWIHPSLPDWNINADHVPEAALKTELVYYEEDPDAWNSMEIICEGMRVQTIVNGHQVADFDGTGVLDDENHRLRKSGTTGCIAFQLHQHDELLVRFKDILIKKLG